MIPSPKRREAHRGPPVRATTDDSSNIVLESMKKEIVHTFGPPRVVVSNNGIWFMAVNLTRPMESIGKYWSTVEAYVEREELEGGWENQEGDRVSGGRAPTSMSREVWCRHCWIYSPPVDGWEVPIQALVRCQTQFDERRSSWGVGVDWGGKLGWPEGVMWG